MLVNDVKLMKIYNEFRFSKGFDVCDVEQFKNDDKHINICPNCLQDCFHSGNKEAANTLNTTTLNFDSIKPTIIAPHTTTNRDKPD